VVRNLRGPTMPTIACPGCGKQYKLPATAAGQVDKCACGKKFKVGGGSTSSSAPSPAVAAGPSKRMSSSAKPAGVSKPAAPPISRAAPVAAAKIDDDFWDEGLKEPVKPAAPPPTSKPAIHTGVAASSTRPSSASNAAPPKKRKKQSGGVKWGFDWGKVVGGLAAFLVFGGLAAALFMSTGRPSRGLVYLALPAIGGLFTAINGIMGEEGIW
jgi:hypothetical protein